MARHVVILAGGSGTRLWPRSRERTPKHLLALHGKRSLLQSTYERVARLTENVYVVTEKSQVESIRVQLPELAADRYIIEPARRGTASALGLAALEIEERDPGATMLSVHADHYLGHDEEAYLRTLEVEAHWAEANGALVTVGLKPPYASTAFGYIQVGPRVNGQDGAPVFQVRRFVEKPDLQTAEAYVGSGDYVWNLGLFSWPLPVFLTEIATHAPALAQGLQQVKRARIAGQPVEADRAYRALPTEAIDYAVMERTRNLLVVGAVFEWHDLGSWADLHDILQQDEAGNFVEGESVLIDSRNCMIHSPSKLVAAVGLEDMVVIETEDAILICPKARSQDVKLIVDRLKQMGKTEYL
ncbi:MAG: mannose-1-phosphate guanylyltransferase [Chloroflexi bacterium]|nr:MAG: mannose-1-phosphate guanylyltransferase [Chloroflexota bacterium]